MRVSMLGLRTTEGVPCAASSPTDNCIFPNAGHGSSSRRQCPKSRNPHRGVKRMSTFRFVHVADVHLDTAFVSKTPQVRQRLRCASREAFRAAVDLSLERGAVALLIAGDLFDSSRLSLETEGFLLGEAQRLGRAGVRCLYATGNHDPSSIGRASRLPWPSSVRLFGSASVETIVIRDADGVPLAKVSGAGHERDRESRNLAAGFPPVDDDLPHIALLHTFLAGASASEGHERYAPSGLEDMRGKGYCYWALGHVHRGQMASDVPLIIFPGNIQGRHHRENGPKGALLVDVDSAGAKTDFMPLAPVEWLVTKPKDLMGAESLPELLSRIIQAIPERSAPEYILRVELAGPCPLYRELITEEGRSALAEDLEDVLDPLDVEISTKGLLPPVDVEGFRIGPHVLAKALEMLKEIRLGQLPPDFEQQLAGDALGLGASGTPSGAGEYILGLVEGLEEELVFRMVKSGEV